MVSLRRTWGRVLLMLWPALMACFLIGHVAHYVLLWFGGYMGTLGSVPFILFAPLAVLARLLTFVAMLLITRNHLPRLSAIAPKSAQSAAERRTGWIEATLSSVVPFFAFYYAAGFYREDMASMLSVTEALGGVGSPDSALSLSLSVGVGIVFVLSFGLKQLWEKFKEKLPLWTRLIAVYLQVVWVLVVVYAAGTVIEVAEKWFMSRSVVAWVRGIGDWFATNVAPVAAAWEALLAVIGVALALTVTALAWLAIAGVVFGESINAQRPSFAFVGLTRAKARYDRIDSRMRRRLKDSASLATGRFLPLWQAFVLMLRAGPGLIGLYILLFQICLFVERWLGGAIPHLFGPHEPSWWTLFIPAISAIPLLIAEPIRIALIAATYDTTLERAGSKRGSTVSAESQSA